MKTYTNNFTIEPVKTVLRAVRTFRGTNGELDEALASLQASIISGDTDPDTVEHVSSIWEEEVGWSICVIIRNKRGDL